MLNGERRCGANDSKLKPGKTVFITHPISETEKALIKKNQVRFKFSRWTEQGYAACAEGNGAIWHLHPESLSIIDVDLPQFTKDVIDEALKTKDFTGKAGKIIKSLKGGL